MALWAAQKSALGGPRRLSTLCKWRSEAQPRDPLLNIWYFYICHAHSHLGEYEKAIEWCRRSIAVKPFWIAYADLASAYAWLERPREAQDAVAELRKLMPDYSVARWLEDGNGWSDNTVFLAEFDRLAEGLRKAGLPDGGTLADPSA